MKVARTPDSPSPNTLHRSYQKSIAHSYVKVKGRRQRSEKHAKVQWRSPQNCTKYGIMIPHLPRARSVSLSLFLSLSRSPCPSLGRVQPVLDPRERLCDCFVYTKRRLSRAHSLYAVEPIKFISQNVSIKWLQKVNPPTNFSTHCLL